MYKIVEVKPLKNCRIFIGFSDGKEGTVDLSDMKGKGVFAAWNDKKVFNAVKIDKESGTVVWPGGIDLCPDVLYSEVVGKTFEYVLEEKIEKYGNK
jgi:hypothetical protein